MSEVIKLSTFNPLRGKVLIEQAELDEQTQSGIYLPEETREKSEIALVLAVGPGRMCCKHGEPEPVEVTVGDIICVSRQVGRETVLNGKKFVIINNTDPLGILGHVDRKIPEKQFEEGEKLSHGEKVEQPMQHTP